MSLQNSQYSQSSTHNYTNKEKTELYEQISNIVKSENQNNQKIINDLIDIIKKEKNQSLIFLDDSGYYINFTKLDNQIIENLNNYVQNLLIDN